MFLLIAQVLCYTKIMVWNDHGVVKILGYLLKDWRGIDPEMLIRVYDMYEMCSLVFQVGGVVTYEMEIFWETCENVQGRQL